MSPSPAPPTAHPPADDDHAKASAIYLQVLRACNGTLGSRTAMWKAFWAAHLIHLQEFGRELSAWPILKWQHGPGPKDPYDLEADLELRGLLRVTKEFSAGYKFVTLSLLDEVAARAEVERVLSPEAQQSVRKAAEWQKHMNAAELSDHSHKNSIAWLRAQDKAVMEIHADLLKEDPLGKLSAEEKERLESDRTHRAAAERYLAGLFVS